MSATTHTLHLAAFNRTGGIIETMRCALTNPTPILDHMAANKSATGGRGPRRYEIRVRGAHTKE